MSGAAIVDFTSVSAIFRHFICLWACLLIMILIRGGELPVFYVIALDQGQIVGPRAYQSQAGN
jgi:hypothetical protein